MERVQQEVRATGGEQALREVSAAGSARHVRRKGTSCRDGSRKCAPREEKGHFVKRVQQEVRAAGGKVPLVIKSLLQMTMTSGYIMYKARQDIYA